MNNVPCTILKIFNEKFEQQNNEAYYNDCIDEYIRVFNKDSKHYDKELYYNYTELLHFHISESVNLNQYIYSDNKRKLIFKEYPKYNEKLNYKKIYFKIKKYKNNEEYLFSFTHMFFILNNNVTDIIECFKEMIYNHYINDKYPYSVGIESKFSTASDGVYTISKKFLKRKINLNKNVKFLFKYCYPCRYDEDFDEHEYEFNIEFDKKPTFANIIKYNTLIILYTIQHLFLSFRNYNKENKDSIYNSETECPSNNISREVMNFTINLYKENYENLINDKIIREQVYSQFINQLENKEDNWFFLNGFRDDNYNSIFNSNDNGIDWIRIHNIDVENNIVRSGYLLNLR